MAAESMAASVTEYLMADHRRLDGLMESCRTCIAQGDSPSARAHLAAFAEGLRRHIRIEEEMLFPVFDGTMGMGPGGPTEVMRLEHQEIQRLLASMEEIVAGEGPSAAEFDSIRSALLALLHEHNAKEERIVYPMTDRFTPPAQRRDLLRRIQEA